MLMVSDPEGSPKAYVKDLDGNPQLFDNTGFVVVRNWCAA